MKMNEERADNRAYRFEFEDGRILLVVPTFDADGNKSESEHVISRLTAIGLQSELRGVMAKSNQWMRNKKGE